MTTTAATSIPTRDLPLRERLRLPLMVGGVLLVAIGGAAVYLFGGRYQSTDDAYVQAARATISSNVSGPVIAIAVHDNQTVHRGDLLFRIDDQPYRIAVDAAQAKLATARLQVSAGKAAYRQQLAALRSAQETLNYQQHAFARQEKLLASGITSQAQLQQFKHQVDTAREQVMVSQHQSESVLAMLDGKADLDPDQHPSVLQAQAELDRAQLNLAYTRVVAPEDGVVTRVEQLQVGDYVNASSPVFAMMSSRDVWIEANFKEDQLTWLRPGNAATVKIDTYPGHALKAQVLSVSPGTGSQFSALPAENATGNWVKVVQRVPVRLQLETADDLPLSSGMSAIVEVDTQHRRSLFGHTLAQ